MSVGGVGGLTGWKVPNHAHDAPKHAQWGDDHRRLPESAPRHRSGRNRRVARIVGLGEFGLGQDPSSLPARPPQRTGPSAPARHVRNHLDRLRQHHPHRAAAVLPRRRTHRTPDPGLHPLERCGHGRTSQQEGRRHRRPPLDLRLLGIALRGRLQSLLPRQGRRACRRCRLLPGPRRSRHLCPRPPRGPTDRGPARQLPHGGRRKRPVELSPPPAHGALLGVPDRVDGAGTDQLDLSRSIPPLPGQPQDRGHLENPRVGVPRRRRVRRAGNARLDLAGRSSRSRQPHLGHQLQPAASRRPGPRQREDHPGARRQSSAAPGGTSSRSSGGPAGTSCSNAMSTGSCSTR